RRIAAAGVAGSPRDGWTVRCQGACLSLEKSPSGAGWAGRGDSGNCCREREDETQPNGDVRAALASGEPRCRPENGRTGDAGSGRSGDGALSQRALVLLSGAHTGPVGPDSQS